MFIWGGVLAFCVGLLSGAYISSANIADLRKQMQDREQENEGLILKANYFKDESEKLRVEVEDLKSMLQSYTGV